MAVKFRPCQLFSSTGFLIVQSLREGKEKRRKFRSFAHIYCIEETAESGKEML